MSKILPKSMPSQNSQDMKSKQSRNENPASEVMFSALFGGANAGSPVEKSTADNSLMATTVSATPYDWDTTGEELNNDVMALMASVQAGRGFGQKIAGQTGDIPSGGKEIEEAIRVGDEENPDALALLPNGEPFQKTQGELMATPAASSTVLANLAFEDTASLNSRAGNATIRHDRASTNNDLQRPADGVGVGLPGRIKISKEFIGPQSVQQNSAEVVKNLTIDMDTSLSKNITSDMAKLRALRAANLEQKNAELDAEAEKVDAGELNGKLGKKDLIGAGLKQMMTAANNQAFGAKLASNGDRGKAGMDVTRLAAASSTALDNAPSITGTVANGSSTGQSGGQAGQQGGGQAATQPGVGLLNSLNNLQMLDTAKDNWTEMLLQRIKSGLSGGKEQLNFQLNPRNLGKMRISLVMQNDRTSVQIQTETSAAASMLSESESRLAQMLEASGLRLGNLNSGQFQGFGSAGSDRQANQQDQNKTGPMNQPDNDKDEDDVVAGMVAEGSDNLINIQA